MNIFQTIVVAIQSIVQNKLRASLTMLGIIIGVGAVIALVAAGAGAQAQVLERFESMGANMLTISPGQAMMMGFRGQRSGATAASFTNETVKAIEELATSVTTVAPQYSGQASIVFGSNNTQTNVLGTTPGYLFVNDFKMKDGRFITDLDGINRERVAVLSSSFATDLFSGTLLIHWAK